MMPAIFLKEFCGNIVTKMMDNDIEQKRAFCASALRIVLEKCKMVECCLGILNSMEETRKELVSFVNERIGTQIKEKIRQAFKSVTLLEYYMPGEETIHSLVQTLLTGNLTNDQKREVLEKLIQIERSEYLYKNTLMGQTNALQFWSTNTEPIVKDVWELSEKVISDAKTIKENLKATIEKSIGHIETKVALRLNEIFKERLTTRLLKNSEFKLVRNLEPVKVLAEFQSSFKLLSFSD